MRPFLFGESRMPLYGVYHASLTSSVPARAALLLNPFGEEAIRAFRPLRLLAERLGQAGIPSLRFDYYGTGDSAGSGEDVRLAQMAEDVTLAHDELEALSGTDQIVWIALRLGVAAAQGALDDVTPIRAVLWEPVLDGGKYTAQLGSGPEAMGFPVPQALRTEIESYAFGRDRWPDADDLRILDRTDPGISARFTSLPEGEGWNAEAALNSYQVPQKTLALLTDEVLA